MLTALYHVYQYGSAVVEGVEAMQLALLKFGTRLAFRATLANESSADELVDLMQRRVAIGETRKLYDSIRKVKLADGSYAVVAGIDSDEDAFYARYVEFGTRPGIRGRNTGVADIDYFEGGDPLGSTRGRPRKYAQGARNRLQYRTHPGTKPKPFFLNSVSDIMGNHAEACDEAIDAAAADAGLA